MKPEQIRLAAQLLADTRRTGALIDDLPAELRPGTVDEAYAIQYAIADIFGAIGGWKVGVPKADEPPRATPIPAEFVLASGSRWPATGPTRIEVELAVKMGASLPPRAEPYGTAEVLGAIADAHIAFELLGARFRDRSNVARFTLLADGQSNGGLVVGAPIAQWMTLDLAQLEMLLRVDGAIDATTATGNAFDATVDALVWLANHAAEHVGGLRQGQVILTGARIGPVTLPAGRHIEAQAGEARVGVTLG